LSRALRSYLFVPGDNETLLGKVLGAGADAVVLDLEDAVRPDRKEEARRLVAAFLAHNVGVDTPVYVRMNALSAGMWQDDLAAVVQGGVHGVRVAKAESAAQIEAVHQALEILEASAGIEVGKTRIVPTIENAAGVLAAEEIAKASRVEALCFGMADFLADIHAHADPRFSASLHALSQLVLASRAACIAPPIGSVHLKLEDDEGLRATSELYRTLGFFGRSVIHPKQLATVHAVFTPSAEELQRAEAVVRAFEASEGAGTVVVDEEFVDEAVVKHARDLLALAASLFSERGGRWP
jgi:citrate lyase subunit beta / citryl-CoA lyase